MFVLRNGKDLLTNCAQITQSRYSISLHKITQSRCTKLLNLAAQNYSLLLCTNYSISPRGRTDHLKPFEFEILLFHLSFPLFLSEVAIFSEKPTFKELPDHVLTIPMGMEIDMDIGCRVYYL